MQDSTPLKKVCPCHGLRTSSCRDLIKLMRTFSDGYSHAVPLRHARCFGCWLPGRPATSRGGERHLSLARRPWGGVLRLSRRRGVRSGGLAAALLFERRDVDTCCCIRVARLLPARCSATKERREGTPLRRGRTSGARSSGRSSRGQFVGRHGLGGILGRAISTVVACPCWRSGSAASDSRKHRPKIASDSTQRRSLQKR